MPLLSLASSRSLANSGTGVLEAAAAFSDANISASATLGQLGGVLYRPGSVSSTWTIAGGTVTLTSTGLPYHSYFSSLGGTTPSAQSYSKSWTYRGGQNTPGAGSPLPLTPIGFMLNGVPMYSASAGNATPSGYSQVSGYNYVAAYEAAADLNYTFFHDNAGAYALGGGTYAYRDYSFSSSWLSGVGRRGNASSGATGLAEASVIPYIRRGLFHTSGHSKMLGIAADGYPIYGPYGYSTANDSTSGVRRMTSGYTLRRRDTRTGDATNVTTYPMGIFTQDYSYTGYNNEPVSVSVTANGTTAYVMTQTNEVKDVGLSTSLGSNPNFVVPAGTVLSFSVSTTGQPFWIKTSPSTGSSNGVSTGEIVNNGISSGTTYWHTGGVTSGTYYYISQNSSNMSGSITITSQIPSDLDTYNGRYCVTPEFPSGTYAYFMTIDSADGAVYPYVIGNTYYGNPATL